MKALFVHEVQGSQSSNQSLLRTIALIVSYLLVTACAQGPIQDSVQDTTVTRSLSPDILLYTVQIYGIRIGMSPRKLQNKITGSGFQESQFNQETLQDIILRFDRGSSNLTSHILLSKGDGTISLLDDITLDVGFCYGYIDSIWIRENILKKEFENRKTRDLQMFPNIIEGVRKKKVLYTGNYKPDKFSHMNVSYIDRGYYDSKTNESVIERSVSVREGIGCYNRTLQRELR